MTSDLMKVCRDQKTHARGSVGRNAALMEALEGRRLLAADLVINDTTTDAADSLAAFYVGRLQFLNQSPARATRDAVISFANNDDGTLSGSVSASGLGTVSFNALADSAGTLTAEVGGDHAGTFTGQLRLGGRRLMGVVTDAQDGSQYYVRANAITPVGTAVNLADATAVNGSALALAGSVNLRQQLDDFTLNSTTLSTTAQRMQVNLNLGSTNTAGLVDGTLSVNGLGDFGVAGLSRGTGLVLLLSPAASTSSDGTAVVSNTDVLRLNPGQTANSLGGRFVNASQGILNTGQIRVRSSNGSLLSSSLGTGSTLNNGVGTLDGLLLGNSTPGSSSTFGDNTPGSLNTAIGSPAFAGNSATTGGPLFTGTSGGGELAVGVGSTSNAGSLLNANASAATTESDLFIAGAASSSLKSGSSFSQTPISGSSFVR